MSYGAKSDLANMVGIQSSESQSQRVETRLIEPRSFSQSQCTFELPQEGILSDDIALQLQLTTAQNAAAQRNELPSSQKRGCNHGLKSTSSTMFVDCNDN